MKILINDIIDFLQNFTGRDDIKPNTDIFKDIGVVGDDFHEIIFKFSEKYSIDMKNYLWYFHTDEEGQNIGALFFNPPYRRVKRIPVTPEMLTEFANKSKWSIQYPKHEIPSKRYDLLINRIILGLFLIFIVITAIGKCSK